MESLSIQEASELTSLSRQTLINYIRKGLPDRDEHGALAGKRLPAAQVPGRSRTGKQYRIKRADLERAGLLGGGTPTRAAPAAGAAASRPRRARPKPAAAKRPAVPSRTPGSGRTRNTAMRSVDLEPVLAQIAQVRLQTEQLPAALEQHVTAVDRVEAQLEAVVEQMQELRRDLDQIKEAQKVAAAAAGQTKSRWRR